MKAFPAVILRGTGRVAGIMALLVVLSSCQLSKNQLEFDRSAEADRQRYIDAMQPGAVPDESEEDIPDYAPVVAMPADLKLPTPLVTVSVNQTVPLRDLLFELAEQADVDLELDPQIRGSLIFTAKDRPFDHVIDRLCEMTGLRYSYKNDVLRVELDRPYIRHYAVDYVNSTRSGATSISTSVEVSSQGDTDAQTSGGSSAEISTETEGDLWADMETALTQILEASDTYTSLATLSTPMAMPTQAMLPPDPNAPPDAAPQVDPNAPPVLNVSAMPEEPLSPNAPATFSINRSSGIVTVFATQRQQREVEKFLEDLRKRSTTQVLIEARVLQVDLRDEYAMGVDWERMNLTGLLSFEGSFPSPTFTPGASGTFTAAFRPGNDLNMAVSALNRFGTVRALSSPRVTVLNNQPAMVNVSQSIVYFDFDSEVETDDETNQTTITIESEIQSVPEGIMLNVVPTANPETGEILMVIRPTVARVTDFVADPTIPFTLAVNGLDPAGAPSNNIPQMSVQEIDSILRVQSGQVVVMGGLMRDSNTVEQEGVPVLGNLPLIGAAFRNHGDRIEKSELVIFIRAMIIPGSNVDSMDRKLYKEFGMDRRPVKM